MPNDMVRGPGRTQQMLMQVLRSRAKNNVIVAHSQKYAEELQERFLDMMALQDLKGRTFMFVGASDPHQVQKTLKGSGAEVFYDHYFWDSWYGRSVGQ